jgi:hypothetical protein
MKDIIRKITDVVTIVAPATIAIFGVVGLTSAVPIAENVEQVLLIILGAASAIASVVYNKVSV